MKRIYTVMVADLFHHGHVDFLRRARLLGDYLVVGLLPDERVASYKREPVLNWEERKTVVESCRYVDEVWPQITDVTNNEFMIRHNFALEVYAALNEKENQRLLARYEGTLDLKYVKRIDYTDAISTTKIIQRIFERGPSLVKHPAT